MIFFLKIVRQIGNDNNKGLISILGKSVFLYIKILMTMNIDKNDCCMVQILTINICLPCCQRNNNQKLGLLEGLLMIGCWEKAQSLLDWLPEFFATTHKPVAEALCTLIHTVMDPVYRT